MQLTFMEKAMISDKDVMPLFAVPLCKTKIEEPSAEIQDYLKNKIKFVLKMNFEKPKPISL